jgi:hypothetical protein
MVTKGLAFKSKFSQPLVWEALPFARGIHHLNPEIFIPIEASGACITPLHHPGREIIL